MSSIHFSGVPEVHQSINQMLFHSAEAVFLLSKNLPNGAYDEIEMTHATRGIMIDEFKSTNTNIATTAMSDPEFAQALQPQHTNQFISSELSYIPNPGLPDPKDENKPLKQSERLETMIQKVFSQAIPIGTADSMADFILPLLKENTSSPKLSPEAITTFFNPIFDYVRTLEGTQAQ